MFFDLDKDGNKIENLKYKATLLLLRILNLEHF